MTKVYALVLCCTCVPTVSSRAHAQTYATFSVPGATSTFPVSINSSGETAGSWVDSAGDFHGFVRSASGTITVFDPPGAVFTQVNAMNSGGSVIGCTNATGPNDSCTDGFLRNSAGDFETVDVPGGFSSGPTGINDGGQITGNFIDEAGDTMGFIRDTSGTYTKFSVLGTDLTLPAAINNAGFIIGNGDGGAFVRNPQGAFILGSRGDPYFACINDEGEIGGSFLIHDYFHEFGFVRFPGGKTEIIKIVGGFSPSVSGLNRSGTAAGVYVDANSGNNRGFSRAADGTIMLIDVPGYTSTYPASINASGGVAGGASNSPTTVGFIFIPGQETQGPFQLP